MNAKTTKTTAELIREMDEQNQAIFQAKRETINTAGFKKKSGQEIYEIREIQPGFKKNGQEFVRINIWRAGKYFNFFCNTESTIQTAKNLKPGQSLIDPVINPARGNNYQLIQFGEIQNPEEFSGYFYIHGIQETAGYVNLIAYTERPHTAEEVRALKNQARKAKLNGNKAEFKRLRERLEKPARDFQRIGLSREKSAQTIKNYKGKFAPLVAKLQGKEWEISGIIKKNGKYTNWTAGKMEELKDFYSPEYMASMIEFSDNDEENYIEPNILGTDFEQFLKEEEPAGATDEDDAHGEQYAQISALTTKWMNAESEAERAGILKEIKEIESFLNPVSSTRYEAEQNAQINAEEETLADLLPDGYKADYRENMTVQFLDNGHAVSFYTAHALI